MSSGPFLPPDPRVQEPYRFSPRLAIRIAIIGVVAVALFAVLFFRLWALQVISGKEYAADARNNQIRSVRLQPPRGPILDREGRPLVTNVAGTVVQLWPAYVPEEELPGVVKRLSALLDVPEKEIRQGIRAKRGDLLTPVIVKTSVHDEKANYLEEHRTDFPGVKVAYTQLRRYENGPLAAHLLGYVGEVSPDELEALGGDYAGGDRIGKTGIEQAYDRYLRGEAGVGEVRVSAVGEPRSDLAPSKLPKAGYAVRLTIDAELQRAAEDALRFGINLAQENGEWAANGGAVVAMDPLNGEVLALASSPTYDPSIYAGRADPTKLTVLYNDPRTPLIDRATYGTYPPGSVFKPVVALAALSEGLITPYDLFQCEPERVIAKQTFRNWDPYRNEPMNLVTALAASCDTYFYDVGLRFFYEKGSPLQTWARNLGFQRKTGLDIGPEARGLVPTPAWRRKTFETEIDRLWTEGDSVQLAIGQGDVLVTPLQMARFYSLIANGGKLVYPHVVADVEQPASEGEDAVVLRSFGAKPPRDLGVSASAIDVIQQGLYEATHNSLYGTSYHVFGGYDIPIAGKTGTAEKFVTINGDGRLRDQSWWCGYGPVPVDEHSLVVCALVENGGHGGEAAAPVALKVFEKFFGVPAPPVTIGPSD